MNIISFRLKPPVRRLKNLIVSAAALSALYTPAQAAISLNIYENSDSQTVLSYSGSLSTTELEGYSVGLTTLRTNILLYTNTVNVERDTQVFAYDFDLATSLRVNRIDLEYEDLSVNGTSLSSALVDSFYLQDPIYVETGSDPFGFFFEEDFLGTTTNKLQIYLPNINEYEEILGDVGTESYTDVEGLVIYDYSFDELGFTIGDSLVMSHGTNGNSLVEVNMIAIPEPSSYSAITGLSALGLLVWQRRRERTVAPTILQAD